MTDRTLIHQVSGPPCAGKSTWIKQHATPQDTILDDNTILATRAGGRHRITNTQWRTWHKYLDHTIATHKGPGKLYYIQGNPHPRHPGITVHLIHATPTQCHQRATNDKRPPITHQWIHQWFTKYGHTLQQQDH